MTEILTLAPADWLVIIGAIFLAFWAGHRRFKKLGAGSSDGAMDYMLAGRTLTAPFFAATLIATWYGAVLGAGEFVARYGVVMILCFGVPYYLVAAVYAGLLSKRIRAGDAVSIPDQIRRSYGNRPGDVASMLILVIAIPAPYMLTLGIIIHAITPLGLAPSIALGSAVALAIVARGGLRSDVQANVVQVILMYAGFLALVIGCVVTFGAPLTMWNALPMDHKLPQGSLGWSAVAVWFLIALQTFIDPNFHVRAAAAKNGSAARKGLLWSIAGWMVFDLLQLTIGLYAVAYLSVTDPSQTFLVAANAALPMVWKGLFVAAVIAAVMSTLDGYALVSATTIGHDLIDHHRGGGHRTSSLYTGLLITGIVGTVLAIAVPSIVDLIFYTASIAVPALLVPLVWSLLRPRGHRRRSQAGEAEWKTVVWITVPAVVSIATLCGVAFEVTTIEPMFTGLATSMILTPFMSPARYVTPD